MTVKLIRKYYCCKFPFKLLNFKARSIGADEQNKNHASIKEKII